MDQQSIDTETKKIPAETPRKRSRLLPKLASLAIQHADLLVVTCCLVGLVALLLLPALAKSTYISENALIPGSASAKYVLQHAMDASKIAKELRMLSGNKLNGHSAVRNFLVKQLFAMGADFYVHPFSSPGSPFSPMRFFSFPSSWQSGSKEIATGSNNSNSSEVLGINVVGIVRAPRGEGNEAIVLVTPFNTRSLTDADASSLGLGLSLFHLLKKAQWLAKDIIWLAVDTEFGIHRGVSAWLRDYHEPSLAYEESSYDLISEVFSENDVSLLEETNMRDFKRAGVITAGIVFKFQTSPGSGPGDSVKLYAEGSNGQMPNLDLINVVNNLAVYREGLHMNLDILEKMIEWKWLHVVGDSLETLGQIAAMINVGWKFSPPASEFVQGAATFCRSLTLQALGVPTGAHGAFGDYQIDAVTIAMSVASQDNVVHIGSLIKFGRLLEGTIRSVNNLLEKFHQSFFLYFLTGPNKFISVGVYIFPLLMLLIALPLKAAALCASKGSVSSYAKKPSEDLDMSSSVSGGDAVSSFFHWSSAVPLVCFVELWSLIVSVTPPLADYLVEDPSHKAGIWVAFFIISISMLVTLSACVRRCLGTGTEWIAVKAATLGTATIGIGIMSLINFAAALVGAVMLVPMCLTVYPLKHTPKKVGSFIIAMLTLLFTLIAAFPLILILSGSTEPSNSSLAITWKWIECMWKWGSATYVYLFLVHLPCLMLCIHLMCS